MVRTKESPEHLSEEIYEGTIRRVLKILLLAFLFLIIGFIVNFPLESKIKSQIIALLNNRSCPIQYDDIRLSAFPPKLKIVKPVIPPRCQGMRNQSVPLKNIDIALSRPSFYPPGLRLEANIKEGKSHIKIFPSISITRHVIKIDNSTISSGLINKFVGKGDIAAGNLKLNALINLQSSLSQPDKPQLVGLDLLIQSKDLGTNSQNLGFFEVPQLDFGKLQLKGTLNQKNQLTIQEFSLGSSSAPIIASFDGNIVVNQRNINRSDLNLSGQVKFSKQFLNQVPLGLILGNKKADENGFYRLKLQGKLGRPKHTFL